MEMGPACLVTAVRLAPGVCPTFGSISHPVVTVSGSRLDFSVTESAASALNSFFPVLTVLQRRMPARHAGHAGWPGGRSANFASAATPATDLRCREPGR